MEAEPTAEELYDQSFIEVPAILDKHKAAAVVCDGKYLLEHFVINLVVLNIERINGRKFNHILFSVYSCS